ncbi:hypothetical protein [Nostoc sp. NMS8]|uniref:hypothetical protein n=1 Tax=Nostoc sp. NMS8 TaxID=2815392 RepID=UPI0025CCC7C9|nr:hypothetical protein [Nostoc sp. NMS8]MBN3958365.1 hypothetical protein [Nostoc sp. NMS8]
MQREVRVALCAQLSHAIDSVHCGYLSPVEQICLGNENTAGIAELFGVLSVS